VPRRLGQLRHRRDVSVETVTVHLESEAAPSP
jgi:hypothetical protein